jgi:uncharacterized protein YukE
MADTQIDLPKLAQSIQIAYDNSINFSLPQSDRLAFQSRADELSKQFDELSGRWFSDTSNAYSTAATDLKNTLTALKKPLDNVANIAQALNFMRSLFQSLTALLGLL